ncbi:hypothetical protein P7K49_022770 [Saguinus oedipus]|uniref:Uncharacterized protein n=1 Tax=Saguinus oedipus TaxID=9490 RepID=A0ABQ9UJU2_SAGOE|nr:hypothetical protein P7K49_022770 [Saguinus oedipus]
MALRAGQARKRRARVPSTASFREVRTDHLALCPGPQVGHGLHATHPTQVQTTNPCLSTPPVPGPPSSPLSTCSLEQLHPTVPASDWLPSPSRSDMFWGPASPPRCRQALSPTEAPKTQAEPQPSNAFPRKANGNGATCQHKQNPEPSQILLGTRLSQLPPPGRPHSPWASAQQGSQLAPWSPAPQPPSPDGIQLRLGVLSAEVLLTAWLPPPATPAHPRCRWPGRGGSRRAPRSLGQSRAVSRGQERDHPPTPDVLPHNPMLVGRPRTRNTTCAGHADPSQTDNTPCNPCLALSATRESLP